MPETSSATRSHDDTPEELESTAAIARDLIRFDTTNYGEGRSNGEADAAAYVSAYLERLGLEPADLRVGAGSRERHRPRRGTRPQQARPRAARPPRRRSGRPRELERRPLRRRHQGRHALGPRRRRHEGHGRHDPRRRSTTSSTAGAASRSATLIVAFFADEENGGVYGAHWLVDNHPELFAGASEAISEVGGYSTMVGDQRAYLLQTGEKALMWIKLIARGPAAHGSRLVARERRHHGSLRPSRRIGRREWPIRLTDTTEQLLAEVARILDVEPQDLGPDGLALATGSASGFIQATLRTTTNPTMLSAGYKHNVIPDRAEAAIDIRTLPGDEEEVLADDPRAHRRRHRDRGDAPRHRAGESVQRCPRRQGRRADRRARSGGRRAALPALAAAPTTRRCRSSASAATASRRCGCRPSSTSRRCSTASTSGCRSTH